MGAFSIAFDIIIVGALALPWVILVFHLFFSDTESSVGNILDWINKWVIEKDQTALAGILLFAMAYPLGSAVSRIARDCFDDDDLYAHLKIDGYERWFRLPVVTETNIRTKVYCENSHLLARASGDFLADDIQQFNQDAAACDQYGAKYALLKTDKWRRQETVVAQTGNEAFPNTKEQWRSRQKLEDLARDVYYLQEGALLLKGADATERLRQFHDQIMVLRGAAFNGLIALSLCLFWLCSGFRSKLRYLVPSIYLLLATIALYNHVNERGASDPPYMEFTLFSLGFAGWHVLWPRSTKAGSPPGTQGVQSLRGNLRFGYLVLAAFLTFTAILGWWSTQVLYDQQIIYSHQAMYLAPPK